MGDIGTHAENLAEYITGLRITELCADLTTFVEGRQLDDDGNVLLHFENGAKGVLHASQIAQGEENTLNIRIYGELGGLEWHQMEPNTLIYKSQSSGTCCAPAWANSPTRPGRTTAFRRPATRKATWRRSATCTATLPLPCAAA
jgi:predicted dehydrogenase